MQFLKGHEKIGGRKKGTPNSKLSEKRQTITEILGICEETIREDIKSLPPSERLKFWRTMQQFVVPKLYAERVDEGQENEPATIEITQEIVYRALSEEEIERGEGKSE